MSFHFDVRVGRSVAMFWVHGRFDLSTGYAIVRYCDSDTILSLKCITLNLGQVSEIADSGFVWVSMFARWAQERNIALRLVNISARDAERFAAFGLETGAPGRYEPDGAYPTGNHVLTS
jgi:hypothetical protein